MKKIAVIFLIAAYLFNLVGYSFFFDYLINKTDAQTVERLDNSVYDEADLFEIKIPLNLPYYSSMSDYERYDGTIELNGIHYNFVKRKVVNDTLYMLCLPNAVKTELVKAKNQFAAKVSDDPLSTSKKGTELSSKLNSFEATYNKLQYSLFFTISPIKQKENNFSSPLSTGFMTSPGKPPEFLLPAFSPVS